MSNMKELYIKAMEICSYCTNIVDCRHCVIKVTQDNGSVVSLIGKTKEVIHVEPLRKMSYMKRFKFIHKRLLTFCNESGLMNILE